MYFHLVGLLYPYLISWGEEFVQGMNGKKSNQNRLAPILKRFWLAAFHTINAYGLRFPKSGAMAKKLAFPMICLLLFETSCTTYHEKPLTPAAVVARLSPPNMDALRVEAKHIKHPILKPIEIDEQRGLTPDQAAILAVLINRSEKVI